MNMNRQQLLAYLGELGRVYEELDGPPIELGICGGASLILTNLIDRATKDIDILFPTPWPNELTEAARIVSRLFGLPEDWINAGPDVITSMGLPEKFRTRATIMTFGSRLTACFASRYDQIFFKVYAAADRAGYHVDDLLALHPTPEEILAAARWCRSHDTSDGFKTILINMLEQLGYGEAAQQL